MKIKACGYVCGTFGHLARSFGEFHLRIWPRHLILFIYLFVAAQPKYVRRDNISHFVPKKEEWVIFTPPPFFTCTHRQTHTHALSPVAPPLSFLPHCTHTHTHVRTQASRHSACFIIHLPTQHSVPETDSIDAKLPVPAGSEPLKTLEAPYRIRLICHRDRLKCGSRVSQAVMTGNDYQSYC